MIAGIFHQGSGLGNQLHRYVATRIRALDLECGWNMIYQPDGSGKKEAFKGDSFMNIDWYWTGNIAFPNFSVWQEKKVLENGVDIRSYDSEFNFIEDNTIIDGEFQDERYWQHREKEVNGWLKVEPIDIPEDVCVIGFRGGEFAVFPDLFLTKEYWNEAIQQMKKVNLNMKFEVHTDDPILAHQFFPDYPVIHNIGINWRSMRYAKYAIIANSSFYILPRWLRHSDIIEQDLKEIPITIAPRYWARHNTKTWALSQNYYKRFTYI